MVDNRRAYGHRRIPRSPLVPPGSTEDPSVRRIVSAIEGLCGGAMLTMISNTALPEAFEQGGDVVGLSCLLGFLTAVTVSAL